MKKIFGEISLETSKKKATETSRPSGFVVVERAQNFNKAIYVYRFVFLVLPLTDFRIVSVYYHRLLDTRTRHLFIAYMLMVRCFTKVTNFIVNQLSLIEQTFVINVSR